MGQPGQPVGLDGAQEQRRDPDTRARCWTSTTNCWTASRTAFDTVGDAARPQPVQAGDRRGDAASSAAANKYISDTEPWKLAGDPARRDTVLHTALQVVSDANTLLTPFLPHAAQQVHEALGGTGVWAAQPEIREVSEEGGAGLPGDHG